MHFASAFLLYGIALVYGATGSLNLIDVQGFLSVSDLSDNGLLLAGMAMLLVGFGFKVAAVPFHAWTPDVYQGAPSPVVSYMAAGVKAAGFAALLRVFFAGFADVADEWQPVVFGLAIASLAVGSLLAIVQTDVKRILAYSSISHAGFILVGVQSATDDGVASVLFYLAAYAAMAVGSFAVITVVSGPGDEGTGIDSLRGLAARRPLLAVAFTVLLLSQAGIPFTAGFWAKFQVISAAVDARSFWLAVIAMLAAVVQPSCTCASWSPCILTPQNPKHRACVSPQVLGWLWRLWPHSPWYLAYILSRSLIWPETRFRFWPEIRCQMVKRLIVTTIALALLVGACGNGDDEASAPPKTERDAFTKWYVQQAVDYYEKEGKQATLDYYNNEAGADDEWYVFIMDANSGDLVAHATIPSRVGTHSGARVDITGHAYGPLLWASDESGHWVDYVFYNPQTDTGGTKHTWAIRRGDLIFGSGWYEDSFPRPPATKSEPGSYTREFVEDAVWFYESNGRQALIDHFNNPGSTDPPSVDGQWYVFVIDANEGTSLAHPTVPEAVGQTVYEILGDTPEGLAAAGEMLTATETGKWVDYTYLNPEKGVEETKHSWIVKRDDVLIGSGWYESG